MLRLFHAVEQHDEQSALDLYQPDVEFHWPPSLPYGRSSRGLKVKGPMWGETWALLQPTEADRKMSLRVVAARDDEVVVLWRQRGVSPAGERFDGEVLGLDQFRDHKLARAQMFYFDTAAVNRFLAKAIAPELQQRARAYWKLRTRPLNQRHQDLNSGRFKSTFSNDELDLLNKLLDLNPTGDE